MPDLGRQLRLLRWYAVFTYPFACVPFLFFYFVRQGITVAEYGALQALYYFAMFAAEVPTGMLADRFGRKPMLVLGPALLALGFGVMFALRSFAGFAAGEVVIGLGHAVLSGAPAAVLYDSLQSRGRGLEYLRQESGVHALRLLGTALAFLLGGLCAWALAGGGDWGYAATLPLTSVLCLCGSLVALGVREVRPAKAASTTERFVRTALHDLRQKPVLWILGYYVVLFALLRYAFHNYQPILEDAARDTPALRHPLLVGSLFFALNLIAAPASRLAPWLVDKFGRRALFWAMQLSMCGSLLLMAVLPRPWGVVLFVVQQLPFGLHWALVQEFVNHRIQGVSRATVLSVLSLGGRLAYAPTALLLFAVQDDHGIPTALALAGGAGALSSCASMWLRPRGLLRQGARDPSARARRTDS